MLLRCKMKPGLPLRSGGFPQSEPCGWGTFVLMLRKVEHMQDAELWYTGVLTILPKNVY